MKDIIKNAIEEYQCPGCVVGGDISCFKSNPDGGVGCGNHMSGTIISNIGNIFLGMPKGFNRLGLNEKMKPQIFESFDINDWGEYDKWNVPVWKFLNKDGHTLVRGFIPRRNDSFIHIFLEDCRDKINCLELTQEDVDKMD